MNNMNKVHLLTLLLKLLKTKKQLGNPLSSILGCKSYIFDEQFNTTEMKQNFVLQEATGKDKYGRDARFTYDSNKPNANITGKKVFVYAVKEGEEASEVNRIGFKTYRSKTGADGKTNNTMQYSKSMRDCFEGKE